MEKFSAFRDPGTGIQPFLRPVPPSGSSEALATVLAPVGYALGVVKTLALLGLAVVYFVLVQGVCLIFYPIRPLHRAITYLFTTLLSRLALLLVGLYWIPVEVVARKRGRNAPRNETWRPRAGDLIVSNWVSWVELLWLAFRFNPTFILPVVDTLDIPPPTEMPAPISRTPGRRTGTGSAAISSPAARTPMQRTPIRGFRRVGLLRMLASTAHLPLVSGATSAKPESLEEIRSKSDAPVVVFPECTTSNGRALLRFADVFGDVKLPVMKFKVFIMCVRYDPPTAFAPTLSHSIPSRFGNHLPHVFKLASSLAPHTMSIRLLSPSESPSSGSFLLSEFLAGGTYTDELAECCAALMSQIGRVKRVGLGWEDKAAFLNLYKGKR
ncbi:hypothetical protein LXA43DRAFT_880282 [Ganoderma leucocontextum]|nr:hypothetical protein LXA43DRAFT_880282 [Ganoderma leucocontextum]